LSSLTDRFSPKILISRFRSATIFSQSHMLPLIITPISAFADNYLWLIRRGNHAAIVDPGDAAPVEAALAREGLTLCAIVLTHHHRDHVGGVADLLAGHHPDGKPRHDLAVFGPRNEVIEGVTHKLGEGDSIRLEELDLNFTVMDVPGHTAGHIAYFSQSSSGPILFCGDTLFASGCGRLFEGTPAQMHESLGKLATLPTDTAVYCTHEYTLANIAFARVVEPGNDDLRAWEQTARALRAAGTPTLPSSIGHELRTNPFLRCDKASVQSAVESRSPGTRGDPVATFAAVRQWKDTFRAA